MLVHTIPSPFFTGPLRSPNRIQNTFANESFIDQVAAAVGAGWDTRPSPKPGASKTGVVTGRGVACVLYEGNNGYSALVAEVTVDQSTGVITVTRFVASQDSGPISNPDGLRNQMEGGALQGMSRALYEQVNWDSFRGVTSTDWRRYKVFTWGQPLPEIVCVPIDKQGVTLTGACECVITIVGAAIANAVFDATGARIRQLPFTPAVVLSALAARK